VAGGRLVRSHLACLPGAPSSLINNNPQKKNIAHFDFTMKLADGLLADIKQFI
jgi:hypothetical protein